MPDGPTTETPPDPARVVADADALAADLLVGGRAREAMDLIRSHSWMHIVATVPLLNDAEAVIEALTSASLATDWRRLIDEEALLVEPDAEGHPGLVAASAGGAATVISLDEELLSAAAGAAIRPKLATSVKSPDAFVRLVDPASLYQTVVGGAYPGPDRDSGT